MDEQRAACTGSAETCDRRVGERLLAALVGLPFAGLGAMALLAQLTRGPDPAGLAIASGLLTPAALLGGFAWQGHLAEVRALLFPAALGGMIVGLVGFLAGFVGPMIFLSESNIAPVIGILFTGPLGFAVGAAGGLVVGALRRPAR